VDLVTIGLVMIGSALLPAFSHPIPKLAEAFAKIGPRKPLWCEAFHWMDCLCSSLISATRRKIALGLWLECPDDHVTDATLQLTSLQLTTAHCDSVTSSAAASEYTKYALEEEHGTPTYAYAVWNLHWARKWQRSSSNCCLLPSLLERPIGLTWGRDQRMK
jgi:hypothetical protein